MDNPYNMPLGFCRGLSIVEKKESRLLSGELVVASTEFEGSPTRPDE
jgi:hypothetical protein